MSEALDTTYNPHLAAGVNGGGRYQAYDSAGYVFPPTSDPKQMTVFAYLTGYPAPSLAALQARYKRVVTIDQSYWGSRPDANALDIETGGATYADIVPWCQKHVNIYGKTSILRLYTNLSGWPSVKAEVRKLPPWTQSRVRYWIAHPTQVDHLVPGSSATQWYWGRDWDESTCIGDF